MTKRDIKYLYERGMIDDVDMETLLNELDDVRFDDDTYTLHFNGKSKSLSKKEYELARFLATHSNKYFSQEEIIKRVWDEDVIVERKTVNVHVCKIKKVFPGIPIKIRKKVGYGWMD